MSKLICFLTLFLVSVSELTAQTPPLPDLYAIPEDLVIPPVAEGAPSAGQRVRQTTAGWEGTQVHHVLYLPTDWQPDRDWPVIVEYAGNGGYQNKYGDVSDGSVEGSRLGYGLTAGRGCLWLCLPYLEKVEGTWQNAPKWWGDVEETKRYCLATLKETLARYQGDPKRVLLCGFSRGSIACNYLGLHDDEIARLWCGFLCHSHYDGVRTSWPYGGADRDAALVRLKRLQGRPQFISHEGSTADTEAWLRSTAISGNWTFAPLPFRNHSDAWTLRDIPLRQQARDWFKKTLSLP